MKVAAIVLAAGKGTRMKSGLAKVLHPVFHQPMVGHVVATLADLQLAQTIVVVGHQGQAVRDFLAPAGVSFVHQEEQLGTGHAVQICQDSVAPDSDTLLILCGDTPVLQRATLAAMLASHVEQQSIVTVLTTKMADPTNYGRIVTDPAGGVVEIVEEKDADQETRKIREINGGVYCVDRSFLFAALDQVGTDNAQGEMYLTDIVGMARQQGHGVTSYLCPDSDEILGVNSRYELGRAADLLQDRFLRELNDAGVTIQRPASVAIHPQSAIGNDSTIGAQVHLGPGVSLGRRVQIGPHSYLEDCQVGDDVVIGPGCHLQGVVVEAGKYVDPGSRILSE
ncbi:MAG: NTP transferase domain-containing protein [Thermodesulfobacteriota bacterium]